MFITIAGEVLRFLDEPINLGFAVIEITGLRMVIFSVLLMLVVLFYSNGLMGSTEFSWDKLFSFAKKKGL